MKKLLLTLTVLFFWSSNYAQEIAQKKESTFKGIKKVMVNADFCTLKMIGYNKQELTFTGIIKSNENQEAYQIKISQEQDILHVNVVKPEEWISHWGELTLMLPQGISVDAVSQSGKIEVNDLQELNLSVRSESGHIVINSVQGTVAVNTGVGNLSVSDFTGDLKSNTKTGNVKVESLKGNCNISCYNGAIAISDVQGKLSVQGGTGNQEVEKVDGDINLKSSSGHMKLSNAKGNILCKTFNGNLKLFNVEGAYTIQSSKGNIVGTRVAFTTSSSFTTTEGNVKIQMDTKSNLAFELKSDNSFLRALGKSRKKSLKIGKGDILITGNSTTGSQAYY
ncbi:hypothetical protein SAMN06265379_102288 [Saccharicrinis carchari]|uniref:DUF4097 domain-containing protein n=1 Tax=Saccharicrinis carchari TaxID=1168039 RepID=A0A521C0S0_SACCC|nr:DUF4097 family beta strand repeat-containing protein [Saccharicrinis carchari]SMO53037.1 hypothetical protein SAMN06265379_102288 [Saccharicrinis carchari]